MGLVGQKEEDTRNALRLTSVPELAGVNSVYLSKHPGRGFESSIHQDAVGLSHKIDVLRCPENEETGPSGISKRVVENEVLPIKGMVELS